MLRSQELNLSLFAGLQSVLLLNYFVMFWLCWVLSTLTAIKNVQEIMQLKNIEISRHSYHSAPNYLIVKTTLMLLELSLVLPKVYAPLPLLLFLKQVLYSDVYDILEGRPLNTSRKYNLS